MESLRPLLIVLEGPDGSGKSTLAQGLVNALAAEGRTVHLFREPGGTELSELVRALLKGSLQQHTGYPFSQPAIGSRAEALLISASRAQLMEEAVRPALERGETVVLDRFRLSAAVYQGLGRGLGVAEMNALTDFAVDGLIPDCTICLEVSDQTAAHRSDTRGEPEGSMSARLGDAAAMAERVRQGYRELAAVDPAVTVLNAEGSPEQVLRACTTLLAIMGLAFQHDGSHYDC
jgi:dTMP kinase